MRFDQAQDAETIERCLLLGSVSERSREKLLAQSVHTTFERGRTIFLQGQPAGALYLILHGWVKLYRTAPNGAEAVVSTMTRGACFAVPPALRGGVYPVSAEAATDCDLLAVPGAAVRRLISEEPEFAVAVVSDAFQHLQELVTQVEQLKARTGPQRVAELLLEMAPPEGDSAVVHLPYDKTLIAARLGMTPESLSRAFAKLKAHGVTIDGNRARLGEIRRLRSFVTEEPAPMGRGAN